MVNQTKNLFLYFIAAILFLLILLTAIYFLQIKEPLALLWFCYIGIAIIIIGIIKRNSNLILSQVLILGVPVLLWMIDLAIFIITGKSLFGIVGTYLFGNKFLLGKIISLQHLIVIPLSIWALALIKLNKNYYRALLISFSETALSFGLFFLIPNVINVDCLAKNCASVKSPSFIPYHIFWWAFMILSIFISYFIITSLPFVKKKNN